MNNKFSFLYPLVDQWDIFYRFDKASEIEINRLLYLRIQKGYKNDRNNLSFPYPLVDQ